jgi:hypothetical protein
VKIVAWIRNLTGMQAIAFDAESGQLLTVLTDGLRMVAEMKCGVEGYEKKVIYYDLIKINLKNFLIKNELNYSCYARNLEKSLLREL